MKNKEQIEKYTLINEQLERQLLELLMPFSIEFKQAIFRIMYIQRDNDKILMELKNANKRI